MHDHDFIHTHRVMWMLENTEGLEAAIDGVAFHYYSGSIEQTKVITDKYPNLTLNFTEGGPRIYDNYDCDVNKWGSMIIRSINCGYTSFTGWNLLLNELGDHNIGPFYCGGLISEDSFTGELARLLILSANAAVESPYNVTTIE